MSDTRFYPSITAQTKWRCQFFDFGRAAQKGYGYFNCGLVERPDGLFLIVRRSRNLPNNTIGFNDLVAVRLAEGSYMPQYMLPINTKHIFDKEHFEDPRAIYHRGITYISACNFIIVNNGRSWSGAHQTLNLVHQLNTRTQWFVDQRVDPIFGYNGPRIGKDTGQEKNWLWFFHQDQLHMIYRTSPHIIARFGKDEKGNDFQFQLEYKTENKLPWDYGVIRGGTPPIKIGDEYLTFFHSSVQTNDQYHRRYYMGAYTFADEPPFPITRITVEPLLVGSWQDRWYKRKPLVVFPCGSRLKDNKWLVTMGVNDLDCAWIEIPHEDLEQKLVSLYQPRPKKFLFFETKTKLKDVTLVLADSRRPDLAERAMRKCTDKVKFGDIKLFTREHLHSLQDYCRFMLKDLIKHNIKTSHVLVAQWDGYVMNDKAWRDDWLRFDYIGAPWNDGKVGNGGFSLRSKKLLEALQDSRFSEPFMPEDQQICKAWRKILEKEYGIKFATPEVARQFSVENDVYAGQFGFHSYLTGLPKNVSDRPMVFTHAGDLGDMIYSLATVKAAGGGVFYVAPKPDFRLRQQPTSANSENVLSLIRSQDYIWDARFSGEVSRPDYDLNRFRESYGELGESLFRKHLKPFKLDYPEDKAWITVDYPQPIANRHIVVNRSLRYHNLEFPWKEIVKLRSNQMVFVGSQDEHESFCASFGYVPYQQTDNLMTLARIIAGAKLFIGNQSAAMAIALGLNQQLIQETWQGNKIDLGQLNEPWNGKGDPNCRLKRTNAAYIMDGNIPWDCL